MKKLILLLFLALTGCNQDPNAIPMYGDSGFALNCRAYVQVSVNSWRNDEYPIDEIMSGLERNCGENGGLWDHKK